jgi:uncharacterized protein (DUF4415 family)
MKKEHIVRYSLEQIKQRIAEGKDGTAWDHLGAMTDEEIERNAIADNHRHGIADDWYENAVPVVSIPVDQETLEYFRSHGDTVRMGVVLRDYVKQQKQQHKS